MVCRCQWKSHSIFEILKRCKKIGLARNPILAQAFRTPSRVRSQNVIDFYSFLLKYASSIHMHTTPHESSYTPHPRHPLSSIPLLLPPLGFLHIINIKPPCRATKPLPIEIIAWITSTSRSELFFDGRTVVERDVEIAYIVEEMDFSFGKEEGCGDGVDGGIAPALQTR